MRFPKTLSPPSRLVHQKRLLFVWNAQRTARINQHRSRHSANGSNGTIMDTMKGMKYVGRSQLGELFAFEPRKCISWNPFFVWLLYSRYLARPIHMRSKWQNKNQMTYQTNQMRSNGRRVVKWLLRRTKWFSSEMKLVIFDLKNNFSFEKCVPRSEQHSRLQIDDCIQFFLLLEKKTK